MTRETTIKGWVTVDKDTTGRRRVSFFPNKSVRDVLTDFHYWAATRPNYESIRLGSNLFKDIQWEDEPVEADVIIRIKKKEVRNE